MIASNKIILYSEYPLFNIFKDELKNMFKTNLCKINNYVYLDENQIEVEFINNSTLYNIINYIGLYQKVLFLSTKEEVGITITILKNKHGLIFHSENKELLNEIYNEMELFKK